MEERRKFPRKYLMAFSSVYIQSTGKLIGYLSDLTLEGLMVISKESLEIDTKLGIYLDLPAMILSKDRALKIEVRVIWIQPDIEPTLTNIGFQFLGLTEEQKSVINQMIDAYEFRRKDGTSPLSMDNLKNG
ncbi:MAG: hypothetical protein DRI32_08870 [Chloroflexi bacterium]|nr:MAG: hypothetical protein DRI32_08870 [Chloroflexota bacterium]